MDYLSIDNAAASALVFGVGIIALFVTLTIAMTSSIHAKRVSVGLVYVAIGLLVSVGIIVLVTGVLTQLTEDGREPRIASIADRYGWEPTDEQYDELKYPRLAPEEGARDLFGHTDMKTEGRTITVQLAWDGHQLLLLDMSDASELELAR